MLILYAPLCLIYLLLCLVSWLIAALGLLVVGFLDIFALGASTFVSDGNKLTEEGEELAFVYQFLQIAFYTIVVLFWGLFFPNRVVRVTLIFVFGASIAAYLILPLLHADNLEYLASGAPELYSSYNHLIGDVVPTFSLEYYLSFDLLILIITNLVVLFLANLLYPVGQTNKYVVGAQLNERLSQRISTPPFFTNRTGEDASQNVSRKEPRLRRPKTHHPEK